MLSFDIQIKNICTYAARPAAEWFTKIQYFFFSEDTKLLIFKSFNLFFFFFFFHTDKEILDLTLG